MPSSLATLLLTLSSPGVAVLLVLGVTLVALLADRYLAASRAPLQASVYPTPALPDLQSLLLHTDQIYHQRVSVFLAAEALLFTGVTQIWNEPARPVICGFSAVATVLLSLPLFGFSRKLRFLMNELSLHPEAHLYRAFLHRRAGPPTLVVLTWAPPILTLLGWLSCALTKSMPAAPRSA